PAPARAGDRDEKERPMQATHPRTRPIDPVAQQARVNLLVAAQPLWTKVRNRQTGEVAYAIPSQSQPNKYHLCDGQTCDCRSFVYRRQCAHLAAVQAVAS